MHLLLEPSTSDKPCASNGRQEPEDPNNDYKLPEFSDDEDQNESKVEDKTTKVSTPFADVTNTQNEHIAENESAIQVLQLPVVQVETYESKSGLHFFLIKLT